MVGFVYVRKDTDLISIYIENQAKQHHVPPFQDEFRKFLEISNNLSN